MSARLLFGWSTKPISKGSEGQLEGCAGPPEGFEGLLEWPECLQAEPLGLQGGLGGDGQMDGQTDGLTNGISPHSTELCPLSGPLPKKPHW